METLTKSELVYRAEEIAARIRKGEIFVHPTDTIYGLGCNAVDPNAITRLRELKGSPKGRPFSIWTPNEEWIRKNCDVSKDVEEYLRQLPGPFTLILPVKKSCKIPKDMLKDGCIGVRMPDHWLSDFFEAMDMPILTTSVNKTGGEFMTALETLDPEIKKGVRFIIYEGEKSARPSKIIRFDSYGADIKDR